MIPTQSNDSLTGQAFVITPAGSQPDASSQTVSSQVLPDLRAEFENIAQNSASQAAYLRAVMRKIVVHCRQVGCGLKGRIAAETLSDFASVDVLTESEQQQLRKAISAAVLANHGEPSVMQSGPYSIGSHRASLLTLPLNERNHRELVGTVCFAMIAKNDQELTLRAIELQSQLLLALQYMPAVAKSAQTRHAEHSVVAMTARVAKYRDSREFAFALVNSIVTRYDCEQACLGVVRDNHVNIWAISGTDKLKTNSPGIIDVLQAMEEARDALETIVFQPEGQSLSQKSMPIHDRLGAASQTAICSIPLVVGEECIAVVTIKRSRRFGFPKNTIDEIEKLLLPFGPAIEMSLRGDRNFWDYLTESARKLIPAIRKPNTPFGRVIRIASIAAAALLVFGWLPYQPLTPCKMVPGDLTQSIAAFDMQLIDAPVRSGDRVKRGDILAKFDTRQLELERAKLSSQYEQTEVEVRKALVVSDAASASLAKANAMVFANQIAAVNKKIEQCTIIAPDDGMVMDAELKHKLGQVFAQGTPILSFAKLDDWQLEIHIPETHARYFQAEQKGTFAPASDPVNRLNYTIENISGSAELLDGKNVFVATASIEGRSEYMRQGMEGLASTNTGWKPVIWIAFHRFFEYGRASFWM
jgi:HlyD family secretion protein